jgi:outer membrane protein assembly factor BamD (BamD/ComL family)
MKMTKGKFNFYAALFAALLMSCVTGAVTIPDDLSAMELIQRAQEASDRNRYQVSMQYYEAVLQRFPYDIEYICAAEYEIAFIHYKQKKYDIAKSEFNALLERYDTPDEELLPPQFKILSKRILAKITEQENALKKKTS